VALAMPPAYSIRVWAGFHTPVQVGGPAAEVRSRVPGSTAVPLGTTSPSIQAPQQPMRAASSLPHTTWAWRAQRMRPGAC
jgi:hypothetical protein